MIAELTEDVRAIGSELSAAQTELTAQKSRFERETREQVRS